MKIIIIDDNKALTRSLAKKLNREWFETYVFHSMYNFKYEEWILYLIDIWLEKPSFSLIKSLREKTDKPIVVYSAYNNLDYIQHAFECWADEYFNKLLTPRVLIYKIKGLINMYNRITWKKDTNCTTE